MPTKKVQEKIQGKKKQPTKEPETKVESSPVVYRYSDAELEDFREIINGRLEVARKELQYLQSMIRGKNEHGEDEASERRLTIEDGSAAMELEQMGQLAARQIQFINNLEKALLRINNKTYGVCRQTGKLIDKARLKAVPHATLSIEAKNNGA